MSQTAVNQFTPSGVSGGGRLLSAALNPQNPSHMFIGCDMGGLYRTENEGLVWQLIPSSIPSENFGNPVPTFGAALRTEIHFTGSGANQRVYGLRQFQWNSSRSRPAVSADGGKTWTLLPEPSSPSEADQYQAIAVDPATTSPATADKVLFWLGDITGTQSWQSYWYYNGPPWRWVRQSDTTLASQNAALLFNIQRACFYNMKTATPNRLISCPWVP